MRKLVKEKQGVSRIIHGDCLDVMKSIPRDSIDSICTDPPYGLEFMGRNWDRGVPGERYWREAYRIAKPGSHMLAFGGTRTFHRLACAIEDAGWEIRDCLMWLYGSGFPKSLDIGKAIDKIQGAERKVVGRKRKSESYQHEGNSCYQTGGEKTVVSLDVTAAESEEAKRWDGWGTGLKPAWEPIILCRKPCKGTVARNVMRYGVGGINIDGCRVEVNGERDEFVAPGKGKGGRSSIDMGSGYKVGKTDEGRWPANLLLDDESASMLDEQSGVSKSKINNRGEQNSGRHGGISSTGPNIKKGTDGLRGHADQGGASRYFKKIDSGRWPANLLLDECSACMLDEQSGFSKSSLNTSDSEPSDNVNMGGGQRYSVYEDQGGASRFFYITKASRAERELGMGSLKKGKWSDGRKKSIDNAYQRGGAERGNVHPTVKSFDLMCYLVRLITPIGGIVLDPFVGSGTTVIAAMKEGMIGLGIEKEMEYVQIGRNRINATTARLELARMNNVDWL